MWVNLDYDDCLWLYRFICIDIFRTRPAKILLNLLLYTIILLDVIQSYLFIQKSDKAYTIKYLPLYGTSFFILAAIYTTPHMADAVSKFKEEIDFWQTDTAGATIERKIKQECLYFTTFIILNTFVSFVSGILHALPLDDDKEIFYPLALIEDYVPLWKKFFSFVYRSGFLVLPMIMGAPFYATTYVCTHIKFQAYMVFHLIELLDKRYIFQSCDSTQFNKQLKKRLVVFIQKHSHFKCMGLKVMEDLSSFVVLFSITGALLMISLTFFIISFEGSFEGRYMRIATFVIPGALVFVQVIISGQQLEDITDKAFDEILKSIDWTSWNKENKMIYLTFLMNNQKPFKVQFSESICLNYQLAVGILKSVYSVVSLLIYIK